jgi:hypothetical protein
MWDSSRKQLRALMPLVERAGLGLEGGAELVAGSDAQPEVEEKETCSSRLPGSTHKNMTGRPNENMGVAAGDRLPSISINCRLGSAVLRGCKITAIGSQSIIAANHCPKMQRPTASTCLALKQQQQQLCLQQGLPTGEC